MMTLNEWQQEQVDDRDAREAYAGGTTVEVAHAPLPRPTFTPKNLAAIMQCFYDASAKLAEAMIAVGEELQRLSVALHEGLQCAFLTLDWLRYATETPPSPLVLSTISYQHLMAANVAVQSRRIGKIQARARRRGRL